MLKNVSTLIGLISLVVTGLYSCSHKWDDYEQQEGYATENLFGAISANPSLSKFTAYLKTTGYADTLRLNKSFTVWAPTDNAFQVLDQAIVNDSARLKKFIAHCIARQSYYTSAAQAAPLRIRMLDGKYGKFYQHSLEDASLATYDRFAGNGVLHTLNKTILPLANSWDYIDSLAPLHTMARYMKGLVFRTFDTSVARQTGVDPFTGKAIYDTPSGMVNVNALSRAVYDLENEHNEYTTFVLTAAAFNDVYDTLAPFYKASTADSVRTQTSWNTVRNLVVQGAYDVDQLPDTLTSKFGVRFPVNKSAIVTKYKTSNGFLYVMGEMHIPRKNIILPIIIQGEKPSGFSADRFSAVKYRIRNNPLTGNDFNDIYVYNHQVTLFNVRYTVNAVYSCKYKVYWVAVNDVLNASFTQRLAIGSSTATTFPYVTVPPVNRAAPPSAANYGEVYVGEYTVANYGNGNLTMYLICNATGATNSNQATIPLVLDYIRMEPVL
jgi:uncharacterized surface protein with fasciclin (FAS1) repeats